MPSFQDSAFLVLIALLLFGPKGLAKLARELGKIMGEFRRASSEFRLQMEDEFRIAEQADQQKKIEAIAAAAPVTPAFPVEPIAEPEHPHIRPDEIALPVNTTDAWQPAGEPMPYTPPAEAEAPLPIASSGSLEMMPPATGLPAARTSSLAGVFDSIPHAAETEATHHG